MEFLLVLFLNISGLMWCYTQQSDKVTDLIYSLSFFLFTAVLWLAHPSCTVHHLLFAMISLWSIRLGIYLFARIHKMDKDARFNQMRQQFIKIAGFWSLQTISILILALPIYFVFQQTAIQLSTIHGVGVSLWAVGWLLETVADYQKFSFRNNQANQGKFVNIGLWKVVQHPNYLGEILCWIGVFVFAIPSLSGWQWIAVISPLWIITLLVFISGIPLLQRSSKKRYGHLESYQAYQQKTSKLIPGIY